MRHGLPLLITLALATPPACAPVASPSSPTSLPPTALMTLDRTQTDLATFIHGRAALVSFWATWCDTCVGEIDALERLDAQASSRPDALIVGVAVGETPETVAAFARQRGIRYAQLVDPDFQLADALGQRSVPVTLVVDRAGRIVYRGAALDAGGLAAFRSTLASAVP